MTGTVRSEEKADYHRSKPLRIIPEVVVRVEHPKYKKAGPDGKCKRCGSKMVVKHRTPMGGGKVHITYICPKCKRPRVGVE